MELRGSEKQITEFVEEEYHHFMDARQHMITDGRSQTHVQVT